MTIAIGCMRLSTAADRDDDRSRAVLDAALAAGVDLLDTADAYARDEHDVGHNERLIAAARAGRAGVRVMTKGGLLRHGSHWHPDGRARHLAEAAAASRERLGAIDLYLLHAVDPAVELATSVRALARLHADGVVGAIGLANVNRTQLAEALALAPLAAVQVELSPRSLGAVRGGVIALARERGLEVFAHRPLGGPAGAARLARDRLLRELGAAHGVDAIAIALAWLRTLGVVPLPGPSTVEHARAAVAAARVALADDERARLDAYFLGPGPTTVAVPARPGEVVMVLGLPGAGKTTIARELVADGYLRLNRDERGGTLAQLAAALDEALAEGADRVVLDNTYVDRAARAPVIAAARRHGLPVRCIVADTSLEDAQVNAAGRLLERHGALLDRSGLAKVSKRDPGAIGPSAQFNWRRAHEPPSLDEGLAAIEHRRFVRAAGPGDRRAVVVELDELIWEGRPAEPAAIVLRPGAQAAIEAWHAAGWLVVATAWRPPPIALGTPAVVTALRERVPAIAAVATCSHPAGPPVCWCRKPLPGLGLVLARDHAIALAASVHVGRGPADRGFAARLGLRFVEAGDELPHLIQD